VTGDSEVPAENDESTGGADADTPVTEPTDLKFVGPATADVVDEAAFDAADITAKRVSYDRLVEAGVNPGVAAKLRRWHSLSWSFDSGSGLDRRSEQVRGLQADERAWVAASSGDWTDADDTDEKETAGPAEAWTPGDGPTTSSKDATTTDDWTPGDWGDAGASADTPGNDPTADGRRQRGRGHGGVRVARAQGADPGDGRRRTRRRRRRAVGGGGRHLGPESGDLHAGTGGGQPRLRSVAGGDVARACERTSRLTLRRLVEPHL
jgi:hypothetical protein